ncbi:MAG: HAD family hydrolase [Candidatus Peribacteraceae bacterium]|nr:HAD family hydrolase [Candidatus Peribacteraceae bacterium]
MKAVIFDYNRTIYNPEDDKLTAGAKALLDLFHKEGITLFLIAKGDDKRRARIQELGLEPYFKKIVVNQNKSADDYANCKKDAQEGTEFFAIGDRVKEEIKYANENGIITIWFKDGKFSTEEPENDAEKPAFIIKNLSEAADIILG